jgi:hypothetical protein
VAYPIFKYDFQDLLMQDFKLPLRLNEILPSSGLLRGVRWFETVVSGQHIVRIFKCQDVQDEFLGILALENGTYK